MPTAIPLHGTQRHCNGYLAVKLTPSAVMDNLLANSMVWSVARPYAFRVEADFVTCTQ